MRLGRLAATVMALATFGAGCTQYSTFAFPVEQGSIDAGRQDFIDLGCIACHTVAGVQLPRLGAAPPLLELGGETSRVKAYSELVTSIINPNHDIAERYAEARRRQGLPAATSPMPFIQTMTVRQLIDIVAFLDSRYVLVEDYVPAD